MPHGFVVVVVLLVVVVDVVLLVVVEAVVVVGSVGSGASGVVSPFACATYSSTRISGRHVPPWHTST
jgi:hypothetical protein